jgi:hypothetical protein
MKLFVFVCILYNFFTIFINLPISRLMQIYTAHYSSSHSQFEQNIVPFVEKKLNKALTSQFFL